MSFDFGKKNASQPSKGGAGFNFGGKSPVDDPIEAVEPSDSLEEEAKAEFNEVVKAYRQRAKRETKRFVDATDSEYWFCTYFRSRKDCEKFLAAAGVKARLNGDKYINGYDLAKILGLKVDFD